MAWAEKLPSGRYRGCYRVGQRRFTLRDAQGKPRTFTRPAEAERLAAVAEDHARQPGAILPGSGRITWGEWREEWWLRLNVEANSRSTYTSKIKRHLVPAWDAKPLDEIDRDAVQDWVTGLAAKELGAASVQMCYVLLSMSLRAAVVAHKIPATPCVGIKMPTLPAPTIRYLARAEWAALRAELDGSWLRLALLLVGTGMRWGEGAALHWQDVHLDHRTASIRRTYSVRGRAIKDYPKSGQARVVPLPQWLVDEMADWDASGRRCSDTHLSGVRCTSGLVVPNTAGKCLSYASSSRAFNIAVGDAGIAHTTMHDLRDTYASWLLQDGVSIEQVAELLGHADINLTKKRYAEFGSSQFDRVRTVLDGAAPVLPQELPVNVVSLDSRRRSGA